MSNSILFFTTKAVVTSLLNDALKKNGGFKNADSLTPLKEKYDLKPLASLNNVSDDTMRFFWNDLLHFFCHDKNMFYSVSEIVTSKTAKKRVNLFLGHSMWKICTISVPLKLKALFRLSRKYKKEERIELSRQLNELGNLYRAFTQHEGKRTIVALVV